MNKYYMVPMTESRISFTTGTPLGILKDNYKNLHDREVMRTHLELANASEEEISKHNLMTSMMYRSLEVPECIILTEKNNDIVEYVTGAVATGEVSETLEGREVEIGKVCEYLDNNDYYDGRVRELLVAPTVKQMHHTRFSRILDLISTIR